MRVRLRTDSDLLLTIITQTLCLVPGSLVLDLDREERTIAVHLLHVRDHEHVELEKAGVLAHGGPRRACLRVGRGDRGAHARLRRARHGRATP